MADTVKLKEGDEFHFTFKYGNFTRTKYGYSMDGEVIVKDGLSTPEGRLFINNQIRDCISENWPGRDGSIRAIVLSTGNNAQWQIVDVKKSDKSEYPPEVRAWNENTKSFESVGWDDAPGDTEDKRPNQNQQDIFQDKDKKQPTVTTQNPPVTWEDMVRTMEISWKAAVEIMGCQNLTPGGVEFGSVNDAIYKTAYTLYADARKMGIKPHVEMGIVEDPEFDQPEEDNGEDEDDDLPF